MKGSDLDLTTCSARSGLAKVTMMTMMMLMMLMMMIMIAKLLKPSWC